ncbi:hypothetical protein [Pseudidiomarina sp. CB1]|uniref:hypothetical protein n=1 Tax=Pseudidiomarina sp. CB1 TaxID=2972484 RepID=UPI002161DBBE|nr:hypothetical protein [Pseudidiomarina sp. CB1]
MSQAEIALGVVGCGTIGGYWLDHFASQLSLASQTRVTALFRSSQALVTPRGIDVSRWRQLFAEQAEQSDKNRILRWIQASQERGQQTVLLDLTAAKSISRAYVDWFKAGAHVISANKYAGSSGVDTYQELQRVQQQYQRTWLYNTTVGAGLPILSAIAERCRCGDGILRVEGNLSGSLSWIFQNYRSGDALSQWLLKARDLGLTEPDPRTDLGGMDVARKLVILAREAGWSLQLRDVAIHNLVPKSLQDCSTEEFLADLTAFDQAFDDWRATQDANAEQWVYLGYIERTADGGVRAGTELVPIAAESSYARLPAGNANFTVRSQQYDANPLIIQGPGAGPEVTAAGVHSDVLQLIGQLRK